MLRIIRIVFQGFVSMLRRQCALMLEIIALRQQFVHRQLAVRSVIVDLPLKVVFHRPALDA